jgi:alpha-mannosidase
MGFDEAFELMNREFAKSKETAAAPIDRLQNEMAFARKFAAALPEKTAEWEKLILKAGEHVAKALAAGGSIDAEKIAREAEDILAPIGEVAKGYTIHCAAHAHIDMNWMWPWQETVSVSADTFATMDKLMDEFPDFHYSQSQASTYIAMEEYHPEIFEMIKKRVKQGNWEVLASTWVEGDKNMFSGESLCRHLLYTRQYFSEKFGLKPEDVKIDWSPDTFGHAHTVPSILTRGGVNRYYFHRTGPNYWLFKWRSPDGSEIFAFKDKSMYGYNGPIDPNDMGTGLTTFTRETGVKDFLYLYGVGDHGGGPTRADLRRAKQLMQWPIFPTVKFSTTHAFFNAVEAANPKLPVIDGDMNFVFEGCYTSQSSVKRANRVSENILPEAETLALVAGALDGMEYPSDMLVTNWRRTLFSHLDRKSVV